MKGCQILKKGPVRLEDGKRTPTPAKKYFLSFSDQILFLLFFQKRGVTECCIHKKLRLWPDK